VTSIAAQAALVLVRAAGDEERTRRLVLEESDRVKSALLSAVSHDLRTPLASIKTAVTTLLLPDTSLQPADRRELLGAINHEVDRLNRLVGNLLDLTRIEAGVLRPALDWYDAHEMLDTVLPRIQSSVGAHSLTVDLQDDIPPIQIDLLRIEELLVNLVENASKYTPAGTPIELRIRYADDTLCLAVVDHGHGVPKRQRAQIFSNFYRGQVHSDRHPGTGLGLAICRGIAEAHNGTVTVEETPGGGATFAVRLPQPQGAQEIHA
jgi:two-component system sensor histidine kinase KdpD